MDRWKLTSGLLASAALLLTAGCASLPADRGIGDVKTMLADRGSREIAGTDSDSQKWLQQLLAQPITADSAARIALVNSPRIRMEYARLGFAAAEVYDAGRLSNPSLSASIFFPSVSTDSDQLGFGLVQSFTDLLLLPSRSRFAEGEFERVKQSVGSQILNLAADTEAAQFQLASARQLLNVHETIAKAAQTSADLAQRFFDAGNISRLELALEQAAAAQSQLTVLQARAEMTLAHGKLNGLMGFPSTENRWKVSDSLPAPLAAEDSLTELLTIADARRLDLAAARKRVSLLADALGVTRSFRFLGAIDLGAATERETDGSRLTGPTLSLELPIFNQGKGRVARAEAGLQEAEAELQSLEIGISNGVQRAAAEVATAKARAEQYRKTLIPLREAIVARTQEEVNFMLEGQFQLLLVKQQEYDAYQGYLEAVRDYWLARVELARHVGTSLPSAKQIGNTSLDAETLIQPKRDVGHMNHGGMQMDGMEDMKMPMQDMDHSDHQMKGMDQNSAPAAIKQAPGGHNGHDMSRTGMEGMGGHQDGKDMPAHGAPAKPAAKKKSSGMTGMDHSGHDMQGMDMPMTDAKPETAPAEKSAESPHQH